MTTTPAMPELPEPELRAIYQRHELATAGLVMSDFKRIASEVLALATLQAQPAEVSDAEIIDALEAEFLGEPGKRNLADDLRVARAILALRPQAESEQEKELRRSLAEAQATISERNAEVIELQKRIRRSPQAVPMTDEPTWIEWAPGDPNPTDSSRIEWVNSAGHTGCTTADKLCWHGDGLPVVRYRITASAGGEEK